MSAPILRLTASQRPMFLLNSRLDLFTAASLGSLQRKHPFSRSYGVILPSSLTRVLPLTLGFSPRLPVSVCGTGTFELTRGFSWQCEIGNFATVFHSPSQLEIARRICLSDSLAAWAHASIRALSLSFCVAPSLQTLMRWYRNIHLLSIAYALRPRLRSRLTLRGRAFLRKP